ncbi:MAG: hypothetical protein II709_03700, partial [Ruminococcus sp.]|nr:hypothetical protein [Ruminococcus sp.]
HDFIFVRSDIAVVKIFECGHCCHLPFQAQQDTTEKEKVQRKAEEKRFFVLLLSEMQYIRLEISKTDSLQATDKGKSQAL